MHVRKKVWCPLCWGFVHEKDEWYFDKFCWFFGAPTLLDYPWLWPLSLLINHVTRIATRILYWPFTDLVSTVHPPGFSDTTSSEQCRHSCLSVNHTKGARANSIYGNCVSRLSCSPPPPLWGGAVTQATVADTFYTNWHGETRNACSLALSLSVLGVTRWVGCLDLLRSHSLSC